MYSETRADNKLDGETLYEYTEIDGKEFLCTNDLVRVNEDGSISFAGRTDKFFVNNAGKRFDAGIVDANMSAHNAVGNCAVVPVFEKRIHDTVPVLYVVPAEKGPDAAEKIRRAFVDVYVKDKKIAPDNLPTQFMIVDDIPLNANGKLDIYRITRERIGGEAYNLIPVMIDGELTDIRTEHVTQINSMKAGALPQGMENNSAINIFDFFTGTTSDSPDNEDDDDDFKDPFVLLEKLLYGTDEEKKSIKLPEIPEGLKKAVIKYGNRLAGLSYHRKWIDQDFED